MWSGAKTAIRNQNDGGGLAVHNAGGLRCSIPETLKRKQPAGEETATGTFNREATVYIIIS